jgi:hypothetical protein
MLQLSRALNPESEHLQGDMRTLRLERTFDAVFVHDAIVYMTSPGELLAALRTAFVHTRPGGVALFAPDSVRETFKDQTALHEADAGTRSLRCLEWSWDPDPRDDSYAVEFAFLLREGTTMRAVHDHHVEGLFTSQTWLSLLEQAGFRAQLLARPLGDESDQGFFDQMFLGRRPAS